jgi:hypothetical protein
MHDSKAVPVLVVQVPIDIPTKTYKKLNDYVILQSMSQHNFKMICQKYEHVNRHAVNQQEQVIDLTVNLTPHVHKSIHHK